MRTYGSGSYGTGSYPITAGSYGSGTYGRGAYGKSNILLDGNSATSGIGTLGVNIAEQEDGNIATGNVGTLGISRTVAITGNSSTLSVGTLAVGERSFAVTGNASTTAIDSVTEVRTNAITGEQVLSLQSSFYAVQWVFFAAAVGWFWYRFFRDEYLSRTGQLKKRDE
jgi:hypothetical protein